MDMEVTEEEHEKWHKKHAEITPKQHEAEKEGRPKGAIHV